MKGKPSFNDEGILEAAAQGISLTQPGSPPHATSMTNLTDVELDASHANIPDHVSLCSYIMQAYVVLVSGGGGGRDNNGGPGKIVIRTRERTM